MINICIADDHGIVREGFKKILRDEGDIKINGEAKDSYEVIDMINKEDCDILLLDLNMPGKPGLELIEDIKAADAGIKILVVSMYPEENFARRALKAGASGYVTKESALDELVNAIRSIMFKGKYISPSLAIILADELDSEVQHKPHISLSNREFQILCLIASAKKTRDIAEELSLSVSTVNTYRFRIMEKMKMKSNIELTRYVLDNNLLME